MTPSELVRWQWEGYPRYHRDRRNLVLHLVVVPVFIAGNVALVVGAMRSSGVLAIAGAAATLVSLALQGRGHRLEPVPPEPFTGAFNAISRIFVEQWVTFPRFVLTGGWLRAFRQSTDRQPSSA